VTCGAEVPRGEPLRAAVRTRLPSTTEPAVAPVPPTARRRELRQLPTPEEMTYVDADDLFAAPEGFDIRPMPGGCLVSFGPQLGGRRR
jgi:hypothetical protein